MPLTNFPDNIDTWTQWLNIVASDGTLILQYQQALQAGNTVLANQILAQIPSATQKIITATDLNKMSQAIQALERFYKTDIIPYLDNKQVEWQTVINQFSYLGDWNSGSTYVKNNLVLYTNAGLNFIYIAIQNVPSGTSPLNTTYWRLLTIQGYQGVSGEGLSYRQAWQNGEIYYVNDAVTYDGKLWMCLQQNQGIEPGTNNSYWQIIMELNAGVYPIQDTEPLIQEQGGLWFNTQNEPSIYFKGGQLTNPASANEILSSYQAYDNNGNIIIGRLKNNKMSDFQKILTGRITKWQW